MGNVGVGYMGVGHVGDRAHGVSGGACGGT